MINANKTPQIRSIPGYPDYFATENGDILSAKNKSRVIVKKPRIQNSGYLYVSMTGGRKSVHRLVCTAWHGAAPTPLHQCRHKNSCKTDNRPVNLAWGTKNQNFWDSLRHGQGKLTPKLVRQMRSEMIAGASYSVLAKRYRVSYHTVYYIGEALTWRRPNCGITAEFREWQKQRRPQNAITASVAYKFGRKVLLDQDPQL